MSSIWAIGIIIGAAFTGVVNSLVKNIINPLIGVAIGGSISANVFIALNGQHYPWAQRRKPVHRPSTSAC
jgi:large-conductance mechanosensitive channel